MKILLMWPRDGDREPDPQVVGSNLERIFSPLFATPLRRRVLRTTAVDLVFLELPVRGWKPPFFEEDGETWALALDYPLAARRVLTSLGMNGRDILPTLCRALQDDPVPLLRELSPPFSLVWSQKSSGDVFLQNDGLGFAQLFEYRHGESWAITNKVVALKALGLSVEAERDEWAAWATLGWFPLQMTGYKRIRFLEPATQVRVGPNGLRRTTHDVLSGWLHPEERLSSEECHELARCSVLEQIHAISPLCERPSVGLSGGWDSRAVVSSLRATGTAFSARVRGLPGRPDVVIASRLARIAGFDLRVKAGSLPPDDAAGCRRSIALALRWQAGLMGTRKHKSFLAGRPSLDRGAVNVMGQHGEIGRSYYAKKIHAAEFREGEYEERLIGRLLGRMPPFMRSTLHDRVREIVREAYRQADSYEVEGLAALDFFYLYERTRRWASGGLNSQAGVVIAPFLTPDYIRATFGYPESKESHPFHRHIIATNAPDWLEVPFADEMADREAFGGRPPSDTKTVGSESSHPTWKRPDGNDNYSSTLYWQEVGRPIIDELLAQGGWWTEVFDPSLAAERWQAAPDELAVISLLAEFFEGAPDSAAAERRFPGCA